MRGTFANVRLRNQLAPGTEGGVHGVGRRADDDLRGRDDVADEGVPLCVLAGEEYGSGSSRDWAAKGPHLLGSASSSRESYERIHRSNLVGMGVLPLQFPDGESVASLGLTGEETFDLAPLEEGARTLRVTHLHRRRVRRARADRHARTSGATSATAGSCTSCCAACVAEPDARVALELSPVEGGIEGRFVVEVADPDVVTAALKEAMTLAAGAPPASVDVWLWAPAPVGSVVDGGGVAGGPAACARAASGDKGQMLAEATGTLG